MPTHDSQDQNDFRLTVPPCRQCRARKVRCDRRRPACARCVKLALCCSFSRAEGPRSWSQEHALEGSGSAEGELTQAGTRRKRTRSACRPCRLVKAKCTGGIPCNRCHTRAVVCERGGVQNASYTGPSADRAGAGGHHGMQASNPEHHSGTALGSRQRPGSSSSADSREQRSFLSGGLGSRSAVGMERAYLELYFERTNPAKCVFLDRSLVMTDWADGRIDIALLKALCACGYRLNPGPDDYQISTGLTPGDHLDDSVVLQWIREAQESVLQRIGTPSLQILQALVLIIRFNIDAADSIVAWNLMPLAARLMFTMRLNYESPEAHPVIQEIRRRLVWAIYLIDCILCGGVQDLVVCPVERLEIRLPCEDHTFEKGAPSRAQFLGEPLSGRTEDMSPAAYLVMLYSVRFRILRLTKQIRRNGSNPTEHLDEIDALQQELDRLHGSFPPYLQYRPETVRCKAFSKDAPEWVVLQSVWLQGYIDLHKFLVPGLQESLSIKILQNVPPDHVKRAHQICLERASQLCGIWSEMHVSVPNRVLDEPIVIISIFQVTRISRQLLYQLPREGPDGVHSMQCKLRKAVAMVSARQPWRTLQPRLVLCLSEARNIVESLTFEQYDLQLASPSTIDTEHANSTEWEAQEQQPNNPHLPSKATFIPDFPSNIPVNGRGSGLSSESSPIAGLDRPNGNVAANADTARLSPIQEIPMAVDHNDPTAAWQLSNSDDSAFWSRQLVFSNTESAEWLLHGRSPSGAGLAQEWQQLDCYDELTGLQRDLGLDSI